MKIAYFIGDIAISGGAERVTSVKANWLVEHGYEVDIITFQGKGKPSFYTLAPQVKIIELDLPAYKNYFSYYFHCYLPVTIGIFFIFDKVFCTFRIRIPMFIGTSAVTHFHFFT